MPVFASCVSWLHFCSLSLLLIFYAAFLHWNCTVTSFLSQAGLLRHLVLLRMDHSCTWSMKSGRANQHFCAPLPFKAVSYRILHTSSLNKAKFLCLMPKVCARLFTFMHMGKKSVINVRQAFEHFLRARPVIIMPKCQKNAVFKVLSFAIFSSWKKRRTHFVS